jgi:hypothetical protein
MEGMKKNLNLLLKNPFSVIPPVEDAVYGEAGKPCVSPMTLSSAEG